MLEELDELKERLDVEQAAHQSAEDKLECVSRELEILKVEMNAARQNLEKAEFDKTKVHSPEKAPGAARLTLAFLPDSFEDLVFSFRTSSQRPL